MPKFRSDMTEEEVRRDIIEQIKRDVRSTYTPEFDRAVKGGIKEDIRNDEYNWWFNKPESEVSNVDYILPDYNQVSIFWYCPQPERIICGALMIPAFYFVYMWLTLPNSGIYGLGTIGIFALVLAVYAEGLHRLTKYESKENLQKMADKAVAEMMESLETPEGQAILNERVKETMRRNAERKRIYEEAIAKHGEIGTDSDPYVQYDKWIEAKGLDRAWWEPGKPKLAS